MSLPTTTDAAWDRLFDVRTKLFYNFVSDYDPVHRWDALSAGRFWRYAAKVRAAG